jgi:hypothetical protein
MKKSTIINPAAEQEVTNALLQPHNLFLADELLKIGIDSYNATVSLGLRNPVGQLAPSFTVKMSLPFALNLDNALLAKVNENKEQIKTDHEEFYNSIK